MGKENLELRMVSFDNARDIQQEELEHGVREEFDMESALEDAERLFTYYTQDPDNVTKPGTHG